MRERATRPERPSPVVRPGQGERNRGGDRYEDRDRERYDRNHAARIHYDRSWYSAWRSDPYPRWYPGRPGFWVEVTYVNSPYRLRPGARAVRCSVLYDELENAHDEWHWRNDSYRYEWWYPDEHQRLMRALDLEWARGGCGRPPIYHTSRWEQDHHHPRTAAAVIVALEVLDILMDGHVHH